MSAIQADIKGFLETSFIDWPGQVASVLFLAGCNFRCPFCHNHGLVLRPDDYPGLSWNSIRDRLARFPGWIDGVVITGGEPTLSPGLADLAREIKDMGFQVKLDTNGGRPEVLAGLIEADLLDHVAMDVKGPLDDVSYARATGRPGYLGRVRESLARLRRWGRPYTLRTTVVPGLHSEDDLLRMALQLSEDPEWVLQNFNPKDALDCEFRNLTPYDPDYFDMLNDMALAIQGQTA